MYLKTTSTSKIMGMKKRIRAVQGGTSASKTISILLYLIAKAQSDKLPTMTSIVSESFPHLRRGVMKDFLDILEAHKYYDDARWDKTNSTYEFETGSKIEFFSADQPTKVRGPRRDRLFINECNNIPYETFDQLEVRTKEFIFLDWNPTTEFWYYDQVAPRTDCEHLVLTYKDNEGLSPEIVSSIEQRKERKGWWQVYGLGLLGEVEGKIYRDWKLDLDEVPHHAKLLGYGLDFGYSVDPTHIVAIYRYDNGYILDEIVHQKGLLNKPIADILNNQPPALVIADCAEPKSIEEIKKHGIAILPCEKGPDSVRNGIQKIQDLRISVTKRSVNIIKAYRNYMWKVDKNGVLVSPNIPDHDYSDAMDAARYGLVFFSKVPSYKSMASKPVVPYYPEIGF